MTFGRAIAICAVGLLVGSATAEDEFEVQLDLKGGHLLKVFFGCAKDASDGFDRKGDIMAPPPGIETGYTAFVMPKTGMFLYKDMRAPADSVTWSFMARVYETKPIVITWDPKKLPDGFDLSATYDKTRVDMRKQYELRFEKTAKVEITASKQAEADE